MERCQEGFEKTRHGHVSGQISRKVDVSFLPDWVYILRQTYFGV